MTDQQSAAEEQVPLACEICESTENVRARQIMNRRLNPPPLVCTPCFEIWYEWGPQSAAEIRAIRQQDRSAP